MAQQLYLTITFKIAFLTAYNLILLPKRRVAKTPSKVSEYCRLNPILDQHYNVLGGRVSAMPKMYGPSVLGRSGPGP